MLFYLFIYLFICLLFIICKIDFPPDPRPPQHCIPRGGSQATDCLPVSTDCP